MSNTIHGSNSTQVSKRIYILRNPLILMCMTCQGCYWHITELLGHFRLVCLAVLFFSDTPNDNVIKWKHFSRYWPLCGEFTGHRWIPLTKASDTELWSFLLRLNKRLSKHWWGWRFETPSRPLWRHCNDFHQYISKCTFLVCDRKSTL